MRRDGLVLAAAVAVAGAAADRIPLDVWTFRSLNGSVRVDNASVPGSSHMHLLDAGVIEDPYFGYNELEYRWVVAETWVYEKTLTLGETAGAKLVFETLDGPAQVLVNGHSVAFTANSFRPFEFEVAEVLSKGSTNTITVIFTPATQYAFDAAAKYPYFVPETVNYNVWAEPSHRSFIRKAGSDFGWDWGPAYATAGIAGHAYLEIPSATLSVKQLDVLQTFDDEKLSAASVSVRVALNTPAVTVENVSFDVYLNNARQVSVVKSIGNDWVDGASVELTFAVTDPILWWPNGYGDPHLYDLRVDARTASFNSSVSHRLGFRRIELVQDDTTAGGTPGKTFFFKVNNVPVFAKGANWIPSDSFPTRVTPANTTHLLVSAQAAHMNMIRVWGGGRYETDHFYSECDRLGLLVWQELMFACGMYPRDSAFLESVAQEVNYQLARLRKYTSIAIWGGNNENENMMEQFVNAPFFPHGVAFNRDIAVADFTKLFIDLIYPLVTSMDPSRPFVDTSPSNGVYSIDPYVKRWGASNSIAFGDVHFYNYDGDCQDYRMYPHARFISEFGFQSAPSGSALRRVSAPSDWSSFQSFWKLLKLRERHENGTTQMLTQMERRFHVPFPFRDEHWLDLPFGATDEKEFGFDIRERIDSYLYLTQIQQSLCYQTAIRAWRRGKNPDLGQTMGILYWQLNDIWEGTSWSSMEFSGRWKSLHHVVKREFSPFILSLHERHDDEALEVYGVSDINGEINVEVEYEIRRTFDGALVKEAMTESIVLSALESKSVRALSIHALLDHKETGCSRKTCFLFVRCTVDAVSACEDTYYFFAPYKHLSLGTGSVTARVAAVPTLAPATFEVTLESSSFVALFVELDVPGWHGIWNANSFLMLPNSSKTVLFTTTDHGASGDQTDADFAALLEIRWLQNTYDALPAEIELD